MFLERSNRAEQMSKAERLYHTYGKLMYTAAYTILQDKQLAEDAVHESFIRIINNLHKIDENNAPQTRSFLTIICRNVAIDLYNKRNRFICTKDMDELLSKKEASRAQDPQEIVINRDMLNRTAKAIKALDPIYRDVFLLSRTHDLSYEEIAKIFGISAEAVKKRLTRAKSKILKALESENN